ncbi:MAG: deoxyguanosinetriphosphate triphosphohydrolase [Gammaproteobacteria bacterium]
MNKTTLAPYAATDQNSRGRMYPETAPEYRSCYQRDRDRIVHASAFRRLEYKTQVFVNHEGDMFRTRLTHSLEVAQIARTITRSLNLNEDLAEAISLAHDLGHTPFGHAGQDTLNDCMKRYGGFEHNLQSLRIVDQLEEKYADFNGLNLTYETREGILKHCKKSKAKALGEIGERFLKKQQPSLEAQLVNIADTIAYNNHDVDDGLRSGLITEEQLCDTAIFKEHYFHVKETWPDLDQKRQRHETIRRMINELTIDLVTTSEAAIKKFDPQQIDDIRQCGQGLILFSEKMRRKNLEIKRFLRDHLYQHYKVHRMTVRADNIIRGLFAAFINDPFLLPHDVKQRKQIRDEDKTQLARRVADYIAGMTDRYAIEEFDRIIGG